MFSPGVPFRNKRARPNPDLFYRYLHSEGLSGVWREALNPQVFRTQGITYLAIVGTIDLGHLLFIRKYRLFVCCPCRQKKVNSNLGKQQP